jgi:putative PIN family toxin of toxin-antitoxin system
MNVLLDTNVVLWLLAGDSRITPSVLSQINTAKNAYISTISLLEISIKVSVGKLKKPVHLLDLMTDLGFEELPIDASTLVKLESLPLLHRDPFDRTIVAAAMSAKATLITGDKQLAAYGLKTILV